MGRRKRHETAAITKSDILDLIKAQKFRCALTGRELNPATATLDHRTSVANGGGHGVDNIWILHTDVNRAKGSMPIEAFIELCCEVAAFTKGQTPGAIPLGQPRATLFDSECDCADQGDQGDKAGNEEEASGR